MSDFHFKGLCWQIQRRPAVPAAVAFMLGIFAHKALPAWPIAWMGLLAGLILAALLLIRRPMLCSIALGAGIMTAGVAASQLEAFFYPRSYVCQFATDQPRLAQLELRIDYPPRVLTWPFDQYRALPPKQVATASVRKIRTWNGWVDCTGDVLVQIAQPHPRLQQGQIIRVIGMLDRPSPAMNPGQLDWAGYYRRQRILASVHVAQAHNITILSSQPTGAAAWLRQQTRRTLAMGFAADRSLDHALLRALLLGDNDPELRDVQEQFRRTGTSHHLAISGMHVAVLGGVVFGACRLLRVGPGATCWISLGFVVVYGIVALPSPPVIRSVLLCTCFATGILLRRANDMFQLLAVSVLVMLLYDPLDMYDAGFQLSFGMVLGLMVFTPALLAAMRPMDKITAVVEWKSPGALVWIRHAFSGVFFKALAAAIVGWVVSMPLIAFHFEQLNPWAIPASIILAPVVLLSLVGGFAKVLLTLLWPSLASVWASASSWPISWMRQLVDWLGMLPGAEVPWPSPPLWTVLGFYALLLVMRVKWPQPAVRWIVRAIAAAGCVGLACVPLHQALVESQASRSELRVTLLAIGAGQCVLIEPPGADAVLIDAGSGTFFDMMRKAIGPLLRHRGRRNIGRLFISHADYDHFSAVADVISACNVQEVFTTPQFRLQCLDDPPAEHLLKMLDRLQPPMKIIWRGQNVQVGPASLRVLWPPLHCELQANDCSQVLRLEYAGRSVLFTGDIQSDAIRRLLDWPLELRADVLVAPHHGAMEDSTVSLVQAAGPQAIVCSSGRSLKYRQREFDRAMRGHQFQVWRTGDSGAITIRLGQDGSLKIEPFVRRAGESAWTSSTPAQLQTPPGPQAAAAERR